MNPLHPKHRVTESLHLDKSTKKLRSCHCRKSKQQKTNDLVHLREKTLNMMRQVRT